MLFATNFIVIISVCNFLVKPYFTIVEMAVDLSIILAQHNTALIDYVSTYQDDLF